MAPATLFAVGRLLTTLLATNSPWSPAEWRININIGREPGTYMPEEWGASGARLSLPLEIRIDSDSTSGDEERDFMGGASNEVTVLEDPTFVSNKGQEQVIFKDHGAWKIGVRRGKEGDASRLRFWVDLDKEQDGGADSVARNDVTLNANERLFFVANCWREPEIEAGLRRYRPLEANLVDAQASVDKQLSHDSGDRRLDGTNPIDTAMASLDMVVLVKNRDDCVQKLKDAEKKLPAPTIKLSDPGCWPGTTERLVIAPGTIGVKRKNGILGAEEFHIVGTWTATPFEGLSEFVEDDEELEEADR